MRAKQLAQSRLHRTKDYYYYRGSRLTPVVGLVGSIVLCLWLRVLGYGLTLNDQKIENEAYAKPVVVVPKDSKMTEKQQILNYIVEVFGDESANAITIINKCENHNFDPKATNWNSNGSEDVGIFMINSVHGYSKEQLIDWKFNIDVAKKIYDRNGWSAWACSHVIGIKSFWQ